MSPFQVDLTSGDDFCFNCENDYELVSIIYLLSEYLHELNEMTILLMLWNHNFFPAYLVIKSNSQEFTAVEEGDTTVFAPCVLDLKSSLAVVKLNLSIILNLSNQEAIRHKAKSTSESRLFWILIRVRSVKSFTTPSDSLFSKIWHWVLSKDYQVYL